MEADVEDFKCVPDYELVRIVLFGVALLAALVAFLFDVAAVPAIIVGLVAAVLFVLELIDRPVVSRFFERGISQNVIARYVPPAAEGASSARRRKVILVAHYDSGRTMPEMVRPVVKLLPIFLKLSYGAMVLTPILLLIKHFAFAHSAGVLALVFNVLIIIGMVLILLSLGRAVLHRTQPYNDAANCNAAGVSVLMEVARRVSAGVVSEEEIAAREAVIHGEEAALEAGLEGLRVYCDETRPLLQGARLTTYELQRAGIDCTLICDNMASLVMKEGKINACFVGCDRVARNGDTANKIGTSGVAILAKYYGIPFYVLGPSSTIDFTCPDGAHIPIEERAGAEIKEMFFEKPSALPEVKCYNPAFDVTDHSLITAIVTEKGICYPPFEDSFAKVFGKGAGL